MGHADRAAPSQLHRIVTIPVSRGTARSLAWPAMSDLRRRLGRDGERAAEAHLRRRGYEVIERNFRTREGELDLIGFDGTTIVFCEVKTRRAGSRERWESLGETKRRQVRTMAAIWLATQTSRPRSAELRFDAIAVAFDAQGRLVGLDHLEGAF